MEQHGGQADTAGGVEGSDRAKSDDLVSGADWAAVPGKNRFSGSYRREGSDCGENCRR